MNNQNSPLWNEELYELLEFFFWEPQHLGKSKSPTTKYQKWSEVVDHLENMEVLLNHHFAVFFNLISRRKKQRLLSELLDTNLEDDFNISSVNTRIFESTINNFTQPDLLFEGLENVVYIEMKLGAKSNCEQLLKYLILHLLHAEETGKERKPYLLFLGTAELPKFFQEKVNSIEELKDAMRGFEIPERMTKGKVNAQDYRETALDLLDDLPIVYINYERFSDVLKAELGTCETETEQKLFQGMINELEKRGLSRS